MAREDLPVCGVCGDKALNIIPVEVTEDVVDPGEPIPVVDVVEFDDVPEVDVDPEPVVRRLADVRPAESVRADDLRKHRERLASSEGWRPWRGRSW